MSFASSPFKGHNCSRVWHLLNCLSFLWSLRLRFAHTASRTQNTFINNNQQQWSGRHVLLWSRIVNLRLLHLGQSSVNNPRLRVSAVVLNSVIHLLSSPSISLSLSLVLFLLLGLESRPQSLALFTSALLGRLLRITSGLFFLIDYCLHSFHCSPFFCDVTLIHFRVRTTFQSLSLSL
jgi:hypothetical protein